MISPAEMNDLKIAHDRAPNRVLAALIEAYEAQERLGDLEARVADAIEGIDYTRKNLYNVAIEDIEEELLGALETLRGTE